MCKILKMMFNALFKTKPSQNKGLTLIYNKIFPIGSFSYLNWCSLIFYKKEKYNYLSIIFRTHEQIHTYQALLIWDSWVKFYLNYFWEWVKALFLCIFTFSKLSYAYYLIIFETEAYALQYEEKYQEFNYYINNRKYYEIKDINLNKRRKLIKKLGIRGYKTYFQNYCKVKEN